MARARVHARARMRSRARRSSARLRARRSKRQFARAFEYGAFALALLLHARRRLCLRAGSSAFFLSLFLTSDFFLPYAVACTSSTACSCGA